MSAYLSSHNTAPCPGSSWYQLQNQSGYLLSTFYCRFLRIGMWISTQFSMIKCLLFIGSPFPFQISLIHPHLYDINILYLNCIFGLDISVKLVMLDVSLPALNYATISRVCKWSTECWEADQMSRLQLCISIFVRFNLWLQRAAVQQWAGQQVNIYRICLCPFSAIVWGVGAQCLVPIIGTH